VAGTIKGITVEIGASTTGLGKALEDVNKKARSLQSELKQVESLLKLNPGNVELLAQKQELLAKAVANAKEKLDTLRIAQAQVNQQFAEGKISEEQYRAFTREIAKAEGEVNRFEGELQGLGTVAGTADERIDALRNEAESAGREMDTASEKTRGFSGMLGSIAGGIGKAAVAGIAAVGAAAAAAGAGVWKITTGAGEAADELITLSNKTGISTKTLQELSYASRFVDVPLETMTDSMFKLTKSMDSARDGSGKQAEAFKALGVSISNSDGSLRSSKEVWTDAIGALGKVSNETERDALAMQLFGKNAKELNPLIAAGSDALNNLAEEANSVGAVLGDHSVTALGAFDDRMQRLKATGTVLAQTLGAAVVPALGEVVDHVREVAASAAGAIQTGDWSAVGDSVSSLLTDVSARISAALPQLATQGTKILSSLAASAIATLPQILPVLLAAALGMFQSVIAAISGNAPALANMAVQMVAQIATSLLDSLPVVLDAGIQILLALVQGLTNSIPQLIPAIIQAIGQIIRTLTENLPKIIEAGLNLLLALIQGILDNLPQLVNCILGLIPEIVSAILRSLPKIIQAGIQITLAVVLGILNALPQLIQTVIGMIPEIAQAILDNLPQIIRAGVELMGALVSGLVQSAGKLLSAAGDLGESFMQGVWSGIQSLTSWLKNKVTGLFNGLVSGVKDTLGIHSPSRVFADIGKNLSLGLAQGITGSVPAVDDAMYRLNAAVGGAKANISVDGGNAAGSTPSGSRITLNVYTNTLDEGQINMLVNTVNRRLGMAL